MKINDMKSLDALRERSLHLIRPDHPMITVGLGTCGIGNGADDVFGSFNAALKNHQDIRLKRTGCFGFCAQEPMVMLYTPGNPILLFSSFRWRDVPKLVNALSSPVGIERISRKALARIDRWDFRTSQLEFGEGFAAVPLWNELPFFKGQEKVVLRDCGFVDPESIEEYVAVGGYRALLQAVTKMEPTEVVKNVSDSKLRGRGGAGFPTGRKWELMRVQQADQKYVVCNADEGDPGAYMNRNEIESDPHMLVEGMAIGAYAMGASKGIVYLRAEYPLAVQRLKKAIVDARAWGFLGEGLFGSSYSFDIEVVTGAGAFVCGEETALIASIEGRAGRPSPRPPFPAERGLYGKPTDINNVETWCNVPVIIAAGPQKFTEIGTAMSAGTKVFSLVGKVKNTGLVELPLGTSLDAIVYGMGEGTGTRKKIRAIQTGGPSGGCIPASLFTTPVDYESLASLGAIMGSGGMVVMDQDNCMVDTARYFTSFTAAESCGKCAPCREGLSQMRHILDRIARGEGREEDLSTLEELARFVKDSALCGLGQTAANPILTTLKYFRDEYIQHIEEKRCAAGVCDNLYLALCENSCPLHMNIPGYLELVKEGRIEEAFELTLRENPLPGSIGRICHFHCQMRCRREAIDEPVAQGEIHRYLADTMYKMGRERTIYRKLLKEKLPATGKNIAIVGAGPAGLTAAFFLVRLGHTVTIYDSHDEAGGILRWGIPAYRLPKNVLSKETDLIKKLGVRFVFNVRVGTDLSIESLKARNDAVLLCIGAEDDRALAVPGEDAAGVLKGYQFLERLNSGKAEKLGANVIVIGGGNSAIDVARSLFRVGSHVTVAYRRTKDEMPANPDELLGAEEEGIDFLFMASPTEVLTDKAMKVSGVRFMKMVSGPTDPSGRRSSLPTGETMDVQCDAVIVAVGEKVASDAIYGSEVRLTKAGAVEADYFTLQTTDPKVWACGDAVSGPATAAEAMGLARRAASAIDRSLEGQDRFHLLFREFAYAMEAPKEPAKGRMNRSGRVPPAERRGNFQEITTGFNGEQAFREASRCLRCDVRDGGCPSAAEGAHASNGSAAADAKKEAQRA
ncbi:MAG TPA: NADH-ubiquinone oxidoreductase-F iron-sulfur binding region domain-containing protein [Spirochaetia bacterium]|nr:NADH-ubiquinone oxidoreductase-F iron-sulfur binding region domain-containing protein [Spirochaetia bacterium]